MINRVSAAPEGLGNGGYQGGNGRATGHIKLQLKAPGAFGQDRLQPNTVLFPDPILQHAANDGLQRNCSSCANQLLQYWIVPSASRMRAPSACARSRRSGSRALQPHQAYRCEVRPKNQRPAHPRRRFESRPACRGPRPTPRAAVQSRPLPIPGAFDGRGSLPDYATDFSPSSPGFTPSSSRIRPRSLRSPITLRSGGGSSFTRVGTATICAPLASAGC